MIRLLIADDHALYRRGLCAMLEEEPDLHVAAEAADGEEAVRRARALGRAGLDLVLMDIDMPRAGRHRRHPAPPRRGRPTCRW